MRQARRTVSEPEEVCAVLYTLPGASPSPVREGMRRTAGKGGRPNSGRQVEPNPISEACIMNTPTPGQLHLRELHAEAATARLLHTQRPWPQIVMAVYHAFQNRFFHRDERGPDSTPTTSA